MVADQVSSEPARCPADPRSRGRPSTLRWSVAAALPWRSHSKVRPPWPGRTVQAITAHPSARREARGARHGPAGRLPAWSRTARRFGPLHPAAPAPGGV